MLPRRPGQRQAPLPRRNRLAAVAARAHRGVHVGRRGALVRARPQRLVSCPRDSAPATSPSFRSASAATSSAGRPTRHSRSRCSTPTRRPGATSSTPPTRYSAWVAGNSGGESETIIGRWMAARGNRDEIVVATKVGKRPASRASRRRRSARAAEASLRRLATDRIDLYYAHIETRTRRSRRRSGRSASWSREGKVRTSPRPTTRRRASPRRSSWPRRRARAYVAIQPHYNLITVGVRGRRCRSCASARAWRASRTSRWPSGFLTGKYRRHGLRGLPRAGTARGYLDERGLACWRRSMRWRRPTRRRSQRSRSPGWPPSRRSWRRSPAPARPGNSPSCCRWAA